MLKTIKRSITVILALCLVLTSVVFTLSVSAAEKTLAVSVDSKTVEAGETVEVAVSITSNPGITMLKLKVEYNTDILTLTGADAKLTFTVSDTAEHNATADIKVSLESSNDILDADLNACTLSATNGVITVLGDELADVMPETYVGDPEVSIRLEDADADPYVSAGIRFKGTLTQEQMADAVEIGFVAAPTKAISADNDWYQFTASGSVSNSIAKTVTCYESATGKHIIWDEDTTTGARSYRLILTELSVKDGAKYYNLDLSVVMYVKTEAGYTYYRIGSTTFQSVYDYYVENGMLTE